MADSIFLDRDFSSNGTTIPAGRITTTDLRDLMVDSKGEHISEDEAKIFQQDLLRRQAKYAIYSKGIHERHEHTQDSGTMAVGGGAE